VADDPTELFAEYADAYARGERPRAADYLERAGGGAEALASMIERFLASARAPAPTAEEKERLAALLETPLLELRKRRRMRVDEVVDGLSAALGIAGGKRKKLRLYYQRLENGTLDPRGVSDRVWGALAKLLGADTLVRAPRLRGLRSDAEVAFYRVDASLGAPARAAAAAPQSAREPAGEERDEVDELFLGP
jgi:hypothetical protein